LRVFIISNGLVQSRPSIELKENISNLHALEVVPDVSMGRLHKIAVHEGADTVTNSVRPLVRVYVPSAAIRVIILGAPVELLTKHG